MRIENTPLILNAQGQNTQHLQKQSTPNQDLRESEIRIDRGRAGLSRTAGSMPTWQGYDFKSGLQQESATYTQKTISGEREYADLSFGDIIDIVNPLHHIPLVGTAYREITGDEINPPSRMIGGTLYGGPIGAASSMVNIIVEDQTGDDIAGNVMAMVGGKEKADVEAPENLLARAEADDAGGAENAAVAFAGGRAPDQVALDAHRARNSRTAGSMPRWEPSESYSRSAQNDLAGQTIDFVKTEPRSAITKVQFSFN